MAKEGEPLPYFPPHLLHCICFLGYADREGKNRVEGSAFWVCRAATDELRHELKFAYLVTAAHVIEGIRQKSANNTVLVCVNTVEGGRDWIPTFTGSWKTHPDNAADIAILKFGPGRKFDHICWETHAFVGSKESGQGFYMADNAKYRIELADEVYFPGLFWPHKGETKNISIVRTGNIACLRGEKVNTSFGLADAYLVEARSIGGLSGSPVFIDLLPSRRELKVEKGDALYGTGAVHLKQGPSSFRLLGVMHGHFRILHSEPDDIGPDAIKGDEEREKINMGIAIVIPAEKILEVIPQYMAEETIEIEQTKDENARVSFLIVCQA